MGAGRLGRQANNRSELRQFFYAEIGLQQDRHLLSLYIANVSDGQVGYSDAMDMDAEDLFETFNFYKVLGDNKDNAVSFDEMRRKTKRNG